jgi:hypothetical protein
VTDAGWGSRPDELAADVRRVSDRLRSLSEGRLAAPAPPHGSCAEAARKVAQQLVEAAQGLAQRDFRAEPGWRVLPVLPDLAVGDQVAVAGRDLLAELAGCGPQVVVWGRGARRTAVDVVTAAAAALAATRRLL